MLPATILPDRLYDDSAVVVEVTAGPRELAGWIEAMHYPFFGAAEAAAGCRGLRVWEIIHGGPVCMFLTVSRWDTAACFAAWAGSAAFAAAHAAAEAEPARYGRLLPPGRYEFPAPGDIPPGDLDALLEPLIVRRVTADYPQLAAVQGFRDIRPG